MVLHRHMTTTTSSCDHTTSLPSPALSSHFNTNERSVTVLSFLRPSYFNMEAAFWHWTHSTPAAHLYGLYISQNSIRHGLYHSREQLHSLQQTMYFDDSIYQLPQPLLERILRIRSLINHATDDLTAAPGHIEAIGNMSPRLIKGKGKGVPPTPPETTDDPVTSTFEIA